MGAALTYARRYALFTLVGIAGEDDVDAPDLTAPTPETEKLSVNTKAGGNCGRQKVSNRQAGRSKANSGSASLKHELSPTLSASLRTELLREIVENLSAADDAALWAQQKLPAKNQLYAADARQVEEAFAAKLILIRPQTAETGDTSTELGDQSLIEETEASQIDKSVLVFPEPRRLRDRDHIRHVMKQPCLICGRRPSDPHHLRFAQARALGRKVSDEFTVPVCRTHHREVHRCGGEGSWWQNTGIDPFAAARTLWLETHPLPRSELTAANNEAMPNARSNDSVAPTIGPITHKSQIKANRVGHKP
jgi:hypothetical protein